MAKYIGKCRVIYNKKDDSYELHLRRNGEEDWGTVMVARCRDDGTGETSMIHYSLLTELLRTVSNGFELIN